MSDDVKITWNDKAFDTHVDGKVFRLLQWIGLRGAAEAAHITDELKAVDTSFFIHSLTYNMQDKLTVWIGSFALEGPVEYAIYILRGTSRMPARPILRIMLRRMQGILKREGVTVR